MIKIEKDSSKITYQYSIVNGDEVLEIGDGFFSSDEIIEHFYNLYNSIQINKIDYKYFVSNLDARYLNCFL
jgi:hypothetical protein